MEDRVYEFEGFKVGDLVKIKGARYFKGIFSGHMLEYVEDNLCDKIFRIKEIFFLSPTEGAEVTGFGTEDDGPAILTCDLDHVEEEGCDFDADQSISDFLECFYMEE